VIDKYSRWPRRGISTRAAGSVAHARRGDGKKLFDNDSATRYKRPLRRLLGGVLRPVIVRRFPPRRRLTNSSIAREREGREDRARSEGHEGTAARVKSCMFWVKQSQPHLALLALLCVGSRFARPTRRLSGFGLGT